MKVVVVDDDAFCRKLMGYYLAPLGIQVTPIASGPECLEQVAGDPPDLILMDCQMAGMDGFETVTRLRSSGFSGRILALTGNSDEETLRRCQEVGMNGHLSKPVDANHLRELVSAQAGEATAPPPKEEEPPADPLARVRQIAASTNNPALAARLIAAFNKSATPLMEQFEAATTHEEVAALAHRMRGSAGTFGAAQLSQAAGELEDRLKEVPLEQCSQLVEQVKTLWKSLKLVLDDAGGSP